MKKVIIFLFIITVLFLLNSENSNQVLIPTNAIRFRLIAASNDLKDQELKNNIKLDLEPLLQDVLEKSSTIEESRKNINNIIPNIKDELNKYNIEYKIKYAQNYFPEKEYENILYKEGNYESLVITLGEGLGDNWWCVLFPPLCLIEAKEEQIDDINYSFFIKKIIDKYY